MNALGGAGGRFGSRVNAVSPVAATRLSRRAVLPGERTPEQVAPGGVCLASPAGEANGVVLDANDGRFARGRHVRQPGLDFGRAPTTPEAVAARRPELIAELGALTG